MKWRKAFRAVHRDVGYAAVALTIAYSLSGVAVNHIEDWNPSYSYATETVRVGPLVEGTLDEKAAHVVSSLKIDPRDVRGHIQENDRELRVFLVGGSEVRLDMGTGNGTHTFVKERAVFFQVNALHLNNLKGAWTWIADIFAIALIALAITGLFMNKGDRGVLGRGKYFVAGGLAIPISAIVYLYW